MASLEVASERDAGCQGCWRSVPACVTYSAFACPHADRMGRSGCAAPQYACSAVLRSRPTHRWRLGCCAPSPSNAATGAQVASRPPHGPCSSWRCQLILLLA